MDPSLSLGVLSALLSILVLPLAGRAPALLLVPIACVPIAVALAAEVPAAEAQLAGGCAGPGFGMWVAPEFVLPCAVLALFAQRRRPGLGGLLLEPPCGSWNPVDRVRRPRGGSKNETAAHVQPPRGSPSAVNSAD